VYIHVPFCTRSCTFCNLNRIQRSPPDDYEDLVIQQILTYVSYPYIRDGVYHAVYFGGGTPTTLSASGLRKVLRILRFCLKLVPDAEVTIETTVSDLTEDKIAVFREDGVNRFSIGVQTFSPAGRRLLGRRGSGQRAADKLAFVRQSGFQDVGIDLLYNYPGESEDDLDEDLDHIEALDLAGLSFYALILREGAALHRMISTRECAPLGNLEHEWALFNLILDRLLGRGFSLLELTKLVKPGRDNYDYVRIRYENGDTLAIGAGAGGRVGNLVYHNPSGAADYRRQVESPTGLPATGLVVTQEYDFAHRLAGRLQYGRLDWADLAPLPNAEILCSLAENLTAEGLMQADSRGFSLTREGVFWGNNIGWEFATALVKLFKGS
jgi:oxygen-independent coproporphyrinogen-3 oxidase